MTLFVSTWWGSHLLYSSSAAERDLPDGLSQYHVFCAQGDSCTYTLCVWTAWKGFTRSSASSASRGGTAAGTSWAPCTPMTSWLPLPAVRLVLTLWSWLCLMAGFQPQQRPCRDCSGVGGWLPGKCSRVLDPKSTLERAVTECAHLWKVSHYLCLNIGRGPWAVSFLHFLSL